MLTNKIVSDREMISVDAQHSRAIELTYEFLRGQVPDLRRDIDRIEIDKSGSFDYVVTVRGWQNNSCRVVEANIDGGVQ
jgi:hypothetical protein